MESHLRPRDGRLTTRPTSQMSIQGFGCDRDGGVGMKSVLLRRWKKNARVEEIRLESDEITVHIVPGSEPLTLTVAGRTTVDSSPYLRSVLLGLLRRATAPVVIIDLSDLSYLDMS